MFIEATGKMNDERAKRTRNRFYLVRRVMTEGWGIKITLLPPPT